MSEQDNEHSEYQGTGKLNSALGRATTESTVAGLVGGAVGLGIGALAKNPVKGALIGANVAGALGGIHGAVKGYQSARDGREQHEGNQDMIAQLRAENAGLRAQMGAVEHVEGTEKPAKTPGQPEEAKTQGR